MTEHFNKLFKKSYIWIGEIWICIIVEQLNLSVSVHGKLMKKGHVLNKVTPQPLSYPTFSSSPPAFHLPTTPSPFHEKGKFNLFEKKRMASPFKELIWGRRDVTRFFFESEKQVLCKYTCNVWVIFRSKQAHTFELNKPYMATFIEIESPSSCNLIFISSVTCP